MNIAELALKAGGDAAERAIADLMATALQPVHAGLAVATADAAAALARIAAIPAGPQGERGPAGPIGPQGEPGPAGAPATVTL